ncbi:UNVERIFIED_CONTAM: hypothetical protein FKN15_025155 [Acipenser sinensis]
MSSRGSLDRSWRRGSGSPRATDGPAIEDAELALVALSKPCKSGTPNLPDMGLVFCLGRAENTTCTALEHWLSENAVRSPTSAVAAGT